VFLLLTSMESSILCLLFSLRSHGMGFGCMISVTFFGLVLIVCGKTVTWLVFRIGILGFRVILS
jgi:hypothetical protein